MEQRGTRVLGYLRFAGRQLISTVFVLFLLSVITFLMIRLIPGDPLAGYYDTHGVPSAQRIAELRMQLGLDQPWFVQYFSWMGGVLTGDFGTSLTSPFDVGDQIARRFPYSLQLALMATALAVLIAIPLGAIAGAKQDGVPDALVRIPAFAILSMPEFLIALIVVLVNSLTLRFQLIGSAAFADDPLTSLRLMFTPALILALPFAATIIRYLRAGIIDDLERPYIRTLRAKGISNTRIIAAHSLRNSLIPAVTVIGVSLASLIGGTIVIENVFTIPGMGQLLIQSIANADYPSVQGAVLVIGCVYLALNLIVDLVYPLIDPRARVR